MINRRLHTTYKVADDGTVTANGGWTVRRGRHYILDAATDRDVREGENMFGP